MSNDNHTEKCPNKECQAKLNPIGNYTYGHSRLVRVLRKYSLVLIPLFIFFTPLTNTKSAFAGLLALIIVPFILVGLVTALFPKTTVISCHECGHQSEHRGKLVTPPALPSAVDPTPVSLEPNEVVDYSVIDPDEFQNLVKEEPPYEHKIKRRIYQGQVVHSPFLRGRGDKNY